MSREIKFRGLADGDWFYGSLFVLTGSINNGQTYISDYGSMVDHGMSDVVNEVALGFFREVGNETVGEYTGLKDRNGVEIFEGDVFFDSHREEYGKVVLSEGAFCVEWPTHIELAYEVAADHFTEVIGNIYENPELLKE